VRPALVVAVLMIARVVVTQAESDSAQSPIDHFLYTLRLIGALLIATLVPLLIDRRIRRSSRIRH